MKNIQNLLDKYFDEQSSSQEETELRTYFAGDVAPEFEMYKPIFEFVLEEQKIVLGAGFEVNLFGNIITDLTEQYFAGETSLEDEQTLREYYIGETIVPELQKYQSWFAFLEGEKAETTSASFEDKVLTEIKGKSSQMRVVSRRNTWLRAVAAGVALLIGAWMFFPEAGDIDGTQPMAVTDQIDWSKYEVTEESAPEEVEEAMRLLAKVFNKGRRKASKDLNKVGQATRILN
ncbi:MAG: hypothetical protein ACI85O_002505 [Saprospiraceae bacterium]|jgi:hypothetical protein